MVRQRPSVGYSLNVFPDETLAELKQTLRQRATAIRRLACGNRALPMELRLSQRMVDELQANPRAVTNLRDLLRAQRLRLVTLNAFVPVSFHEPNLKERVYLPAWHESDERVRYTCACGDLLAALAPPEVAQPSLSVPGGVLKRDVARIFHTPHEAPTNRSRRRKEADASPVAFFPPPYVGGYETCEIRGEGQTLLSGLPPSRKRPDKSVWPTTSDDVNGKIADALRRCAEHCQQVERHTGRRVVVALEPEPGLTLERTEEVIVWFRRHFPRKKGSPDFRRYLGVNFDVCHQLVEFEDPWSSVAALNRAGIPIFKIHVSNCIEIAKPLIAPELLESLRLHYAESKFLHQTCGVNARGRIVYFSLDLPDALSPDGLRAMARAGVERIRIHYHMPLLPGGNMPTTFGAVESFVRRFAMAYPDVPLVIETYTWMEHLAARHSQRDLLPNIAAELRHVRGWL